MTKRQRQNFAKEHGLGPLYLTFDTHKEGLEACAAVQSLIDISLVEKLRSSFLLPLQGNAVKAEVLCRCNAQSANYEVCIERNSSKYCWHRFGFAFHVQFRISLEELVPHTIDLSE
jgi:hypothetical protein